MPRFVHSTIFPAVDNLINTQNKFKLFKADPIYKYFNNSDVINGDEYILATVTDFDNNVFALSSNQFNLNTIVIVNLKTGERTIKEKNEIGNSIITNGLLLNNGEIVFIGYNLGSDPYRFAIKIDINKKISITYLPVYYSASMPIYSCVNGKNGFIYMIDDKWLYYLSYDLDVFFVMNGVLHGLTLGLENTNLILNYSGNLLILNYTQISSVDLISNPKITSSNSISQLSINKALDIIENATTYYIPSNNIEKIYLLSTDSTTNIPRTSISTLDISTKKISNQYFINVIFNKPFNHIVDFNNNIFITDISNNMYKIFTDGGYLKVYSNVHTPSFITSSGNIYMGSGLIENCQNPNNINELNFNFKMLMKQ
jgi:hypothetical protein